MRMSQRIRRVTTSAVLVAAPVLALLVLTQSGVESIAGEAAMIDAVSTDLLAAVGPAQAPTESLSDWQYTGYWSWIWVWQWVRVGAIWRWLKIRKSHWCN